MGIEISESGQESGTRANKTFPAVQKRVYLKGKGSQEEIHSKRELI